VSQEDLRNRVRAIVRDFYGRGDEKGWFEQIYATAQFDPDKVPWADSSPNATVIQWLDREKIAGNGRKALVVGCGLGDDAEELARRGFDVTAFDISATAIAWCARRNPQTRVKYVAADLFSPPTDWKQAFDFVLEVFTLQAMRDELRAQAIARVTEFVAPRGQLLIICRGRDDSDPPGDLPYPLLKRELAQVQRQGLRELSFEDFMDTEEPPVRRFRVRYQR
jgi:SAM-dependent methyltransferase